MLAPATTLGKSWLVFGGQTPVAATSTITTYADGFYVR